MLRPAFMTTSHEAKSHINTSLQEVIDHIYFHQCQKRRKKEVVDITTLGCKIATRKSSITTLGFMQETIE